MIDHLKTSTIPIAEALGMDISKYLILMEEEDLYERIDSLFRREEKASIHISQLPSSYSFEYKQDIMDDAILVALLDGNGSEIGDYIVRAINIRVDDPRPQVAKIKRRLVFVGKGLISLHADGPARGIDHAHLNIMKHR